MNGPVDGPAPHRPDAAYGDLPLRDPSAMPATGIDGTLVPAATRTVPGAVPAVVPAS
ncbi:MAG: hypothetical protein ACKORL_07015 [Phycisphaerales bacterium]